MVISILISRGRQGKSVSPLIRHLCVVCAPLEIKIFCEKYVRQILCLGILRIPRHNSFFRSAENLYRDAIPAAAVPLPVEIVSEALQDTSGR